MQISGKQSKPKPEYRRVQQQRGKKGSFYSFYVNIPNSLIDKLQITKGSIVRFSLQGSNSNSKTQYLKMEKVEVHE